MFGVERKQYLEKDGEYSKAEWTNIGVCTLKFPNDIEQFDICVQEQKLPFQIPAPLASFNTHLGASYSAGTFLQMATEFIQMTELAEQNGGIKYSEMGVHYTVLPVPYLLVMLKRQEHGDYKYVRGDIWLPRPNQENEDDNRAFVSIFMERDDDLLVILVVNEKLELEDDFDVSYTTESLMRHSYAVRIVSGHF